MERRDVIDTFDVIDALMDGEEPVIAFRNTYLFREELQRLGLMEVQYYVLRNRKDGFKYVPGDRIAGLSYIVNHGSFKTKNTFVKGQRSVIMQDL